MDERQQRAWQALELGPMWQRRHAPPVTDAVAQDDRPEVALDWEALQAVVGRCPDCRLARGRTRSVFGAGRPGARWMLLGVAPSGEDDATGEPFSGEPGRLLAQMLVAAGIDVGADAFITQLVKCRPPQDRDPGGDEVASCRRHLERQAALVDPILVVALGGAVGRSLLASDARLSEMRGTVHRTMLGGRDVPVVVTFEPRHLLSQPSDKAGAWADLCLARGIRRTMAD